MFVFKNYQYDVATKTAHFRYQNNGITFEEVIAFARVAEDYNQKVLDRALFLAFILIGTSYYKTFPSTKVTIAEGAIDEWQAAFFNTVYQEGMSQFAFENDLKRGDLAYFDPSEGVGTAAEYQPKDIAPLVLQSGGKDSLLVAELLRAKHVKFTPWYISSVDVHPKLLDDLGSLLVQVQRLIDHAGLKAAKEKGGRDGHVPVTYIVFSIALIQAILLNKNTILAAIGNEGEEPHGMIGDLPIQHQWAKTWRAEQNFAEYVTRYISPVIRIGSPLRKFSELNIAELFVKHAWETHKYDFSSCNIGNYKQGQSNETLGWCGECPKCANSFLLFAPFVNSKELIEVFGGENLFTKDSLLETFKGLLGVGDVMKPLECVGEIAELRKAYHMARARSSEYTVPFDVPESDFDYKKTYSSQEWTNNLI